MKTSVGYHKLQGVYNPTPPSPPFLPKLFEFRVLSPFRLCIDKTVI